MMTVLQTRKRSDSSHVTEEELETTEGEEVDLLTALLEMTDWEVKDQEKEKEGVAMTAL